MNRKIVLAVLGVMLSATALVGANENIRNAVFMTLDDVEAQGGYCLIEVSKITHYSNGSIKSEVTSYMHCDGHDDDPCGQYASHTKSLNNALIGAGCTGTMHNGN